MKVNGIGPVEPVTSYNKTSKTSSLGGKERSDSINVSDEALKSAEMIRVAEEVRSAPDIRMDRVAEIKAKLEDPNYIDDTVMGAVADSLMNLFGV
ncbi:MAG: flagellar biosynthesis anti-sigma factor FlgM [Spirochaetaceae bacterium]|jgi:negative regulator of flagellin synthesis FlgM|nr:flagellar biosynthesis anti-sigma factor FlgM [Spirochaetaceae bacterium]